MTPHELNRQSTRILRNKSRIYPLKPRKVKTIFREIYGWCESLGITYGDLKNTSRKQELVNARIIIARMLRDRNQTLIQIRDLLGRYTHATICYYLEQYEALKSTNDKAFMEMLRKVR